MLLARKFKVPSRQIRVQELRSHLKEKLLGIRRRPALLYMGETRKVVGCGKYELCKCEPMHDLKNVITSMLEELPRIVVSSQLKAQITELKTTLSGK